MALPPDSAESFVREVDENLRRDQMQDAAKRYAVWIAAAVILLLAAIGGYLIGAITGQARGRQSEEISAALDRVNANVRALRGFGRCQHRTKHTRFGMPAAPARAAPDDRSRQRLFTQIVPRGRPQPSATRTVVDRSTSTR